MHTKVIIIGAGPAGLTAAYQLAKAGSDVTVLEADPTYVGGLSKTITYQGYCFDIGGHRFFSKSTVIEAFWNELLPNDMLTRPRSSRIFYRNQFFTYPLNAVDVLRKLGVIESVRCLLSYIKARLMPIKHPASFADWVINRFGQRLYLIFFKTYTEKVWGMSCDDISADWAAQRIKGLSLMSAITHALFPTRSKPSQTTIKTLINHFRYPRKGPGMLWEACAAQIQHHHGRIHLGCQVVHVDYQHPQWHVSYIDAQGNTQHLQAPHLISSAPLRDLVLHYLKHQLSLVTQQAASQLRYRDFLMVVLMLRQSQHFQDQWIYIHDPHVDVARIQNFKAWSAEMVSDPNMTCYGMEYFCFEHNALWNESDAALIEKGSQELIQLGLAKRGDIEDAYVVRQTKAYPVYDHHYQHCVNIIRNELSDKFPTLHPVGRNGMHQYNNQDHSMMTAMLTVNNILAGNQDYDVWQVNQDAEYIETMNRQQPQRKV